MKFRMIANDFAIDLGTSTVSVYKKNEGLVLSEPSLMVLDENSTKVLAVGNEAKEMLGKTPSNIHVVKPIVNGVITDFNLTEAMLNYFFNKINPGMSLIQPKVVISIPDGITDIETRAIEDAALHAGSREIILAPQTLAQAFGMGLSPDDPRAILMVSMGAGTTEVSVLSLNGIVTNASLKKGGDYIDEAIIDLFKKNKKLDIGKNTAENIKNNILSLRVKDGDLSMDVDGRDMISASPKTVEVKSRDLVEAVITYADEVMNMIYEVLEKTPPELTGDIRRDGFYLSGGFANLKGIREYIESKLKISSYISEEPGLDAILGAGKILEEPDRFLKYRK
ncbi:rod shape-determining protein [Anaerococcus sp. Marseille-Q7828]|uniref:rod shape-determining protein n=1 Tax=Anaerococcus sp. Marseille-Q7828 TaxID=3036300 RepID=UPI0024AE6C91|nr:rod shape-determining protein [Anaerococcus sp. Marseille-Q7828]